MEYSQRKSKRAGVTKKLLFWVMYTEWLVWGELGVSMQCFSHFDKSNLLIKIKTEVSRKAQGIGESIVEVFGKKSES